MKKWIHIKTIEEAKIYLPHADILYWVDEEGKISTVRERQVYWEGNFEETNIVDDGGASYFTDVFKENETTALVYIP